MANEKGDPQAVLYCLRERSLIGLRDVTLLLE